MTILAWAQIKHANVPIGLVGGGVVDNLAVINAEIARIGASGTLWIPRDPTGIGYAISATLTIPRGVHLFQESALIYTGVAEEPGLVIGSAAGPNYYVTLEGLEVSRLVQSSWANEENVGIRIINPLACKISIRRTNGFTIGYQLRGDGEGAAYNEITLQRIANAKIGGDLDAVNAGWVNENNLYGGEYTCFSAIGTGLARIGMRITSSDGSYLFNNNNVAHKPSFELNQTEAGAAEALPILMVHGQQNGVYSARNETGGAFFVREENASQGNEYDVGYGIGLIDRQTTFPSSVISSRVNKIIEAGHMLFNSGPMHKTACYADGATGLNIPRVSISISSQPWVLDSFDGLSLNANYVEVLGSRGVAVLVDTRRAKRFVVRKDTEAGFGGRVGIRCYDAAGVVLTNGGAGHPYVKTQQATAVGFSGDFGGIYQTGGDSGEAFFFEVGPDVMQVAVILTGGTAVLRIRSFQLMGSEQTAAVFPGYEEQIPGVNLASVPPTAGTWVNGRMLLNRVQAVGQPRGWVCSTAGTPGVWTALPNL